MKKATSTLKLKIPANKATPAPPIGPVLGQRGLRSDEFCREFNNATSHYKDNEMLSVSMDIYNDRTYSFTIKSPSSAELIKKLAGVSKGSSNASKIIVGSVTKEQLYELAQLKQHDPLYTDLPIKSIVSSLAGTAKSIGISIN